MNYNKFYDIAEYLNGLNRNIFSHREVAWNAHIYACDLEWSKANDEVAHSIKELCKQLIEDGEEQSLDWVYDIARELNLIDMDYMDYIETDKEVLKRFIQDSMKLKERK